MAKKDKRREENSAQKHSNLISPILGTEPPAGFKLPAAALYLGGLSKVTMYRLINSGLLRPCRAVLILLFTRQELDRFLAENS